MPSAPVALFIGLMARLQFFFLMALAVIIMASEGAKAQENIAPPAQKTVRMSQFTTQTGPVRLIDASSLIDLFVPVSSAVNVGDVTADLRFTHSIALQGARSYLAVRLNEATLAQIPFDPAQPLASARVRLPAELWRAGYNKLTLAVVQHYTDGCEDPEAPELWTELDLFNSTLTYSTAPISSGPVLRDLSGLFSPGLGGMDTALILTSPSETGQSLSEEALPLVAQALALRRQFAPLFVEHEYWREQGADGPGDAEAGALLDQILYLPSNSRPAFHVLVGTFGQLTHLLPDGTFKGINGPNLMISREGNNSRLIVTGPTPADVIVAARALAEMDDAVNPGANVSILSRDVNDKNHALVERRVLRPDTLYTLEALGIVTKAVMGAGSQSVPVQLPVPANYYTDEAAQAELLVDFGYGAGMGPGSVMNVMLNGEYIHGLLLDNPNGASYRRYRIFVPARRLVPGRNNVVFYFNLRPQAGGGDCAGVKGHHLMAQILDSSTFRLPPGGAVATQPNLALFTGTGFPYVTPSSTESKTIMISDRTLMGSALTLVGKLAQVAQAPLGGWRIGVGKDYRIKGNAIILATPEELSADLFASWSAALGRTSKWPYQALNDVRKITSNLSGGIPNNFFSIMKPQDTPDVLQGSITQAGGFGSMGAIAAFRNPYDNEASTITLITAGDKDLLRKRIADLVQGEIWGQIEGHLSVWDGLNGRVTTMRFADHFEIGGKDQWLWLRLVLSNNPWYWIGAVLGTLLLAVASAVILLARRRQRLESE